MLLSLLVLALLLGVVWWAFHRIAQAFSLPPMIVVVGEVILVLVAVGMLLQLLGLGGRLWTLGS